MSRLSLAAILMLIAWIGAVSTTITVGPEGCDYTSIRAAIRSASPGDVIEVKPGTYNENIVVDIELTIQGAGSGKTIIQGTISLELCGQR